MSIARVSALEAHDLVRREAYTIVDVRTEAEYAGGHPAGAYNVPVVLAAAGGMAANARFVADVRALFPSDAKLLLGCQSGQRSLRAAELLAAAGYSALVDLRPGFAGARDPFGRVTEPGWQAAGCPCEVVTPGCSYAELRARIPG
ncbi:MAG: rhodanese-like domain-containing protein [Polyangiaceae bacterium]|nr:rhodanese-like domain-containing protein [Polyangiaceae bacterium]